MNEWWKVTRAVPLDSEARENKFYPYSGIFRPMRIHIAALSTLLLAFLAGCGDSAIPEAQVRTTLAAIEAAAEARDVGGVMEHVSDQFRDAYGGDGTELSRYVRGYFIANQSLHLL